MKRVWVKLKKLLKIHRVSSVIFVDSINKIKYLSDGPKYSELIYINPCDVLSALPGAHIDRADTGKVLDGDWDLDLISIDDISKYRLCRDKFLYNSSWEDVGYYELMRNQVKFFYGADRLYGFHDIKLRCEKLDVLYYEVKSTGVLKTRKELNKKAYRESGGVYIHIGRNGNLIFGGGGCHRLAIAKALGLKKIPAQLGVVHRKAIKKWRFSLLENNERSRV